MSCQLTGVGHFWMPDLATFTGPVFLRQWVCWFCWTRVQSEDRPRRTIVVREMGVIYNRHSVRRLVVHRRCCLEYGRWCNEARYEVAPHQHHRGSTNGGFEMFAVIRSDIHDGLKRVHRRWPQYGAALAILEEHGPGNRPAGWWHDQIEDHRKFWPRDMHWTTAAVRALIQRALVRLTSAMNRQRSVVKPARN